LLLEEYGVKFEYLPVKRNVVADALYRLYIDELTIQTDDAPTFLPESKHSSIKLPMHIMPGYSKSR
jgi:hypothetical protein